MSKEVARTVTLVDGNTVEGLLNTAPVHARLLALRRNAVRDSRLYPCICLEGVVRDESGTLIVCPDCLGSRVVLQPNKRKVTE